MVSLGALNPNPTQSGDRVGRTSSAAAITPSGSHIVGNSGYTVSTVQTIQPPPIIIPAVNPETGEPIYDQNGNPTYVTIIPDPYDVETVIEQGTEGFVYLGATDACPTGAIEINAQKLLNNTDTALSVRFCAE